MFTELRWEKKPLSCIGNSRCDHRERRAESERNRRERKNFGKEKCKIRENQK